MCHIGGGHNILWGWAMNCWCGRMAWARGPADQWQRPLNHWFVHYTRAPMPPQYCLQSFWVLTCHLTCQSFELFFHDMLHGHLSHEPAKVYLGRFIGQGPSFPLLFLSFRRSYDSHLNVSPLIFYVQIHIWHKLNRRQTIDENRNSWYPFKQTISYANE